MRTLDELRLTQIADFFGVIVENMRRDRSALDITAEKHLTQFGIRRFSK